jgi:thiamine biosynthesis lipoprotein
MRQTSRFAITLVSLLFTQSFCGPAVASEDFSFYHENVLGTSLELCVRADSLQAARQAEHRVLAEIDRLTLIFSGYDPTSELSRWQGAPRKPIRVSRELYEVLEASEYWGRRSDGAFDPGVEVLSRLWAQCSQMGRLPTQEETSAAKALLIKPAWRTGPVACTVQRLSDCPLSLDGIAKGYIVEKACDSALEGSDGVSGVVLNVGGDLRVRGLAARTIGVAAPWADSESSEPAVYIEVRDHSVATSGKSRRGFQIKDRWYSHVFNPRTARPVERVNSVTVVAERGADADALAKICGVLEPKESLRLINSLAGVECLIVTADGEFIRSAGWQHLERPRPIVLALASQRDADSSEAKSTDKAKPADKTKAEPKIPSRPAWNKEFELIVNIEINHPEAEKGRYRRPYVAIWVEDSEGRAVRTLALWVSMGGSGPFQWLPDLKYWYKSEEERKLAEKKDIFFAVARPTRLPGKYRLIWDGKDNHGKQLGGGEYTIFIDAAREHGTYQNIRQHVSLSDKPFREDLKGNVEIRSASIEYRRKAAAK